MVFIPLSSSNIFPLLPFYMKRKHIQFYTGGSLGQRLHILCYHIAQWDFLQVLQWLGNFIILCLKSEILVEGIHKYVVHMISCDLYIEDQSPGDTSSTKRMRTCVHTLQTFSACLQWLFLPLLISAEQCGCWAGKETWGVGERSYCLIFLRMSWEGLFSPCNTEGFLRNNIYV